MSGHIIGIFLVLCSSMIEAFGQIFLKNSVRTNIREREKRGWLAAGVGCMAADIVVWTFALTKLSVSIAYPMASLSFVMVVLLSRLVLREKVSKERWIGVVLILFGTAMLGLNS